MSPSAKIRVSVDEIVELDRSENLPYLKYVELNKCVPSQFGLEKWTRPFVIPDNWMRKIYKNDVWRDTELPEPTIEPISERQKKILCEWLFYQSPVRDQQPSNKFAGRRSRNVLMPCDDLLYIPIELASDDDCDRKKRHDLSDYINGAKRKRNSKGKDNDTKSRIPVSYDHRIESEHSLFERAIQMMQDLSAEEEAEFNTLINDQEFMNLLSDSVGDYLGLGKAADH